MKIAYIGTYPPRECGIGTFTRNKFTAMMGIKAPGDNKHEGIIIAINNKENTYSYPDEVKFTVRQDEQRDYLKAADFINESGADVCILEHEFGIYGGNSGIYVLPLMHRLKIPVIVVFHTVLKTPSYNEKSITIEIAKMAARIVVMSHKAIEFLTEIYDVPRKRIALIPHGVPDMQFAQNLVKDEFGLHNKKVLLTFGLIGRNKGIETVIKALPPVVAKHADVLYIVLGKTHPAVLRHEGEEYRDYLIQLTKDLQLEQHVLFLNEFVDENMLFKYLSAADIYVTPYLNEAQITSGTLSYAVGAGCAVISTPYWHASELLANNRGRLFSFGDIEGLSSIFTELLDKPESMQQLRKNALAHGREITWPKVGEKYHMLAQTILQQQPWQSAKKEVILDPMLLPAFTLEHARRITDDTGIIQHAKFSIPNRFEGYCQDDNARALLMALMAYRQTKSPMAMELIPTYLSYMHHMQNDDGSFRNFMGYNRQFLDEVGSEDCFGRTIWALGYLILNAPNDALYQTGREMFFKAMPQFKKINSIRGMANTIIGISYYLRSNPGDMGMASIMRDITYHLLKEYDTNRASDWKWFESILTYDNAVMPLSLLHAGDFLKDEKILKAGMESMRFLSKVTLSNGYLSVIGNEQWYTKGGVQSVFAQQPLDAMGMVLMFQKAFHITKDTLYLNKMHISYMWFLGENDLRMSLYDYDTKGCCDGLESYGINRNQGAESTLAYLISQLAVMHTFKQTSNAAKEGLLAENKGYTNKGIFL